MSTIVFAALLPLRIPEDASRDLAEIVSTSVRARLGSRFEQKSMAILNPEAPRVWSREDLSTVARELMARFIIGIDVLELGEHPLPDGASPERVEVRAKVRVHVWDAQATSFAIDGATSEAGFEEAASGRDRVDVESAFVRVVESAAAKAMAPLLRSE